MLWADPSLARGVLLALAATQATRTDPAVDAQPGKILHEARGGEMAALGEIPFKAYYGSVDATPLFVLLAGRYYQRTGDIDTIRRLWPHIEAALAWIDRDGDADGDGFVEYARATERGLANQGWKDSHDAIFHADGTLAEGPVALCEVQGYVYAAKMHAADLAAALGNDDARADLAAAMPSGCAASFEQRFWCDDLGAYALALDGDKRPCRVVSSNAAQCLMSGIASPERARRVADTVMRDGMFSGWGIRTIREGEARYNPMAYHNGSIWPHDTALVALGLARYGLKHDVVRIAEGLFAAAQQFDLRRLPELFCGFGRHAGESPTRYPTACSPQAWAAASSLLVVQALLGLEIDGLTSPCHAAPAASPVVARVDALHPADRARRRAGPAVRAARRRRRHERDAAQRRRGAGHRAVAGKRQHTSPSRWPTGRASRRWHHVAGVSTVSAPGSTRSRRVPVLEASSNASSTWSGCGVTISTRVAGSTGSCSRDSRPPRRSARYAAEHLAILGPCRHHGQPAIERARVRRELEVGTDGPPVQHFDQKEVAGAAAAVHREVPRPRFETGERLACSAAARGPAAMAAVRRRGTGRCSMARMHASTSPPPTPSMKRAVPPVAAQQAEIERPRPGGVPSGARSARRTPPRRA